MPKKKPPSLTKHKEAAWHEFSLYIRYRDALLTTGTIDRCACVTCGRVYPTTGQGCIQAGHFIAGRGNAVLFDERGVHGQCWGCNSVFSRIGKGAPIEYRLWMDSHYPPEVVDELIANRHQVVKYKAWDYDRIAEEYKAKTQELLAS